MGFKKLRGVPLPEEKQGLIRYTCLTYAQQPPRIQRKIDKLLQVHGGEYADALRLVMLSRESITAISLKCHVSEETLYRLRRAFYTGW